MNTKIFAYGLNHRAGYATFPVCRTHDNMHLSLLCCTIFQAGGGGGGGVAGLYNHWCISYNKLKVHNVVRIVTFLLLKHTYAFFFRSNLLNFFQLEKIFLKKKSKIH